MGRDILDHDRQQYIEMKTTAVRIRRRNTMAACWLLITLVLLQTIACTSKEFEPRIDETSKSELFEIAHGIEVLAPSHFPKPTRKINATSVVPIVEPTFGKHRPGQDAVMAYAEGYELAYYMSFVKTLRSTGFDGDIVLALASEKLLRDDVEDYLRTEANLVVYIHELHCYQPDGVTPSPRLYKKGQLDVFQMCHLNDVYGWKDEEGNVVKIAKDPRIGRVVATLRYEWYWIWSLRYNPNSWLMLIDFRDTFFQKNPFEGLPRKQDGLKYDAGLLYFYGENAEATRLGLSRKNMNWLKRTYGEATLAHVSKKPTICSGSTMGEQLAIETYLRAMVNEWDETDIKMTGADQGFHNYLYYSGKLTNSATISKLMVWEQGKGIINNMGALRTKKFVEWGIYDEDSVVVYNWDGTVSPVVHQYDRDYHLHNEFVRVRFKQWKSEYERRKSDKKRAH